MQPLYFIRRVLLFIVWNLWWSINNKNEESEKNDTPIEVCRFIFEKANPLEMKQREQISNIEKSEKNRKMSV